MMGQRQSSLRNRDMAAYYYRNTTRNPEPRGCRGSGLRKPLSHTDDPEQNEQIEQAYQKWKADYNR